VAAQIQPRRAAPQRSTFTCRCGTVDAAALTAKANSQEVPVLTALPGSFRFNHVLLRESTQFSSTPSGTLSVAMGRPGNGTDVISPFTLRNPVLNSFWYDRPDLRNWPVRTIWCSSSSFVSAGGRRRVQSEGWHSKLGGLRV
jgi:hypothetical protein